MAEEKIDKKEGSEEVITFEDLLSKKCGSSLVVMDADFKKNNITKFL